MPTDKVNRCQVVNNLDLLDSEQIETQLWMTIDYYQEEILHNDPICRTLDQEFLLIIKIGFINRIWTRNVIQILVIYQEAKTF